MSYTDRIRSLVTLFVMALLLAATVPARAADFSISVDTGPNHIRNITLRTFLDRLRTATNGAVIGKLFESGQLFSARDEPKAVASGEIDMTVTTNASISAFVSDVNLLDTPLFSGLDPKVANAVVDGPVGKALARRIARRLRVEIPGRWLLLGNTGTFGGKRTLKSYADFKGARIRIPGGASFTARYKALGAEGVLIPFPDVPLALSQGTIDALLTTDETLRSAKLYDAGVHSAFVDRISVLYYIPMVSRNFWGKLTDGQRKAFVATWESVVDGERTEALRRQDQARADNAAHGVTYYEPSAAEAKAVDVKLRALMPELAKQLKIDPKLVALATRQIDAAR